MPPQPVPGAQPTGDTVVRPVGVTVRPAHPDELVAAGAVVRDAYAADGLGSEDYLDVLADAPGRSREAEIAVAVDEGMGGVEKGHNGNGDGHNGCGDVLGCVTFVLPGSRWAEVSGAGEAEFRMLGVSPRARGRGVGTALVRWCIARARELGRTRLLLCSSVDMTDAHRLYRREGFARRPDLDFSPKPRVELLCFDLALDRGLGSASGLGSEAGSEVSSGSGSEVGSGSVFPPNARR
jgi:GNAT superfamily N-acetyltransferase